MDRLEIRNFAGIEHLDVEFKPLTVFIGPQASGKSIIVKLRYVMELLATNYRSLLPLELDEDEMQSRLRKKFTSFFNEPKLIGETTKIHYQDHVSSIILSLKAKSLIFKFDKGYHPSAKSIQDAIINQFKAANDSIDTNLAKLIYESMLQQSFELVFSRSNIFIPASRSSFYTIEGNSFKVIDSQISLDSFMKAFGGYLQQHSNIEFYKGFKDLNHEQINDVLKGKFGLSNEREIIISDDNRKTQVSTSSSGQQEALPMFKALSIVNSSPSMDYKITIEEPEAHLFPSAQKKIVELLASLFNDKEREFNFYITTHSPYILSALNNLIEAGNIAKNADDEKKARLHDIIPEQLHIDIDKVAVYGLKDGKLTDLIDREENLIDATFLDEVSNEIGREFDQLLAL